MSQTAPNKKGRKAKLKTQNTSKKNNAGFQKDPLEWQRHKQLLRAVNSVASVLLNTENETDLETSLLKSIEIIGYCMSVDRVRIWRDEMIDGEMYYVLKYQWLSDYMREIEPLNTYLKYSHDEPPEWDDKLARGEHINGPISSMPLVDQEVLDIYGIKSIFVIPLFLQNQFWGFFSLDDNRVERYFDEDEIDILRSGCLMIANAIIRSEHTAQIREAHERTRLLLDSMPMTSILWNRDFRILDCNEEAVKLFRMKDKQMYIGQFFDLSPKYQPNGQLSSDMVYLYINKTLAEGKCVFEWMHSMLSGELLPVEMTLVRLSYGKEIMIAAYARDLREHKTMMAEIEQRDRLLSTVNDAAVFLLQSETDEPESSLNRFIDMLAETLEVDCVRIWKNYLKDDRLHSTRMFEWLSKTTTLHDNADPSEVSFGDRIPWWEEKLAKGDCINCLARDLPADDQAILNSQGILSFLVIPVFVRSKFWGFIGYENRHSERLFTQNEQSALSSASMLMTGFLLRHDMTLSIRAAAEKLETMIANYPGLIWCVDKNGIITLFNGQQLNSLGLVSALLEGKKLDESLNERQLFGTYENINKTFREGPQEWNTEIDDKVYHIRSTPIFDNNGNVTDVMGSFDDITERTRLQEEINEAMEEAQHANRAKSSFLANMSHEMRTPLNAIIGLSELILGEVDMGNKNFSDENYLNLEKVYNAGITLLNIVNDILDISKIEAGKFELAPIEYDTPSLINDAVTQSVLHIGEKPIRFYLKVDENMPTRFYDDELRIKQIFNNLLSNAFKYTKKGAVEFSVSCSKEGDSVWMTACVKDTGIGIKPEDLNSLFSNYGKMDKETNRKIQGTGLGLAITKMLVEMMGGSVSVKSVYGKGSVFTVKIPQKVATDAVIGPAIVNSLESLGYSDHKRRTNYRLERIQLPYARVLVVDDVQTNLDVAMGMMKPYGMKIDCATSGQQAIDAVRDEKVRYNAIFMDHMMPDMDGIESARIIREEIGTEYAKTVPIIAFTANALVGNEEMFLRKGFQAYLSKPLDMSRLDVIINKWVRDSHLEGSCSDVQTQEYVERRAISDRRKGGNRRTINRNIEGLNIRKAIERLGGDKESFLKILRSYCTNSQPLLKTIEEVDEDNLANFAIIVHGLKSSSYSICADIAGAKAEALEKAAKAGDFGFVSANNADFLQICYKLVEDIKGMLDQIDKDDPKPTKPKPDANVLLKLLSACENYEMDSVDEAMAEIEAFNYTSDENLVLWLRENVAQMNLEQIKKRLLSLDINTEEKNGKHPS